MELIYEGFRNKTELYLDDDLIIKLGKVAAKIAYYNFEWRLITLVVFNSMNALGLQTFLMNYNKSIVTKFGMFTPRYSVHVIQFVIFGEDAYEISSKIEFLVNSNYDRSGKFLIICASHVQECEEHKIFQTLAKNRIVNVIVLKISKQRKTPVTYSYHNVVPGNCDNDKPEEINLMKNCINDSCYKNMYPDKLTNFQQCRLVVSAREHPPFMHIGNRTKELFGIDVEIMKLVANMINATLVIKPAKDQPKLGRYSNNKWTGCFDDLYNGRAHVGACSSPLTASKYDNFQISGTYYSMDIVWAAKLPIEKPSWEKLMQPLSIHIRIILFVMFIGIILMDAFRKTKIWMKMRKILRIKAPKHNLLFYSWILFLGMPSPNMPKKMAFLLIVYAWIWFCLIVRSAYQAALITSIKLPSYYSRFETLSDFLKAGHPWGGPANIREYFNNDSYIYENWIVLDSSNSSETLKGILNASSDFVIASDIETLKYYESLHGVDTKKLQFIPQKIVNSPTVVYFQKYSPLTAPVSRALRIAMEGGFIDRLYDHYSQKQEALRRRAEDHDTKSLKLGNFAGCFILLIMGWILSAIYFAIEMISRPRDEDH